MGIQLSDTKDIEIDQILVLYVANKWSAAEKPKDLYNGLINSHSLITAWDQYKLVGLGNALSDGHLVVYYPHLLVLPAYQSQGIGKMIIDRLLTIYQGFHMQMLTADDKSIDFYQKAGFVRAGNTQPMWIYKGKEH